MKLSRRERATVSLLLVVVSVLSTYPAPLISFPKVDAASYDVTLEGRSDGWNVTDTDPSIVVANGDTVNLLLKSLDISHVFYIDINGNGVDDCPQEKCSEVFPPDRSLSFSVDFPAGTYEYVCPFHPGTMRESFVVRGFDITSTPSSLRIVQGSSDSATITVASVNGFTGDVNLAAVSSPAGPTLNLNPPSITFLPGDSTKTSILTVDTTSTLTGSYTINATGTSGVTTAFRIVPTLVVPPDFSIGASPTVIAIPLGSAGSSTISLTSLDSFSGNIDLSTSPPPTGVGFSFSQDQVFLPSGGSVTSVLDVDVLSSTVPGTYLVDVIGTSGSLVHSSTITVVAGRDFGISASPAALVMTPGSSGSTAITVTSFNDFAGRVNLTATGSAGGLTFSFNPASVVFSGSGEVPSVLAIDAPETTAAINFTITVTATNGSIVHLVELAVSVRDFSITVPSPNLTVRQGSSITTTVSIASINRFTGVVNLTTTAPSLAPSRLLNVTSLSLNPAGNGFAALTLDASSVAAGTYTVTLAGTSGSRARTVLLTITVQPSPEGASLIPLIAVGLGATAAASAGFYVFRRRTLRGRKSKDQNATRP